MSLRIFVGSGRVAALPAHDRGFAYGDGLFETMRAHRGRLPWWDAHWTRLRDGAQRLRLALPVETQVRGEAEALLDGGDGVLKLIVSRGEGGRGYAPPAQSLPTWTLSTHPVPAPMPREGLTLRWCATRLAIQPALAGIKHCNRLEQILARAEWNALADLERDADEGLMRSTEDDVICATAANLFLLSDEGWITPKVDRSGIAGVCRAWAIARLQAKQVRVTDADVEIAQAVFLCNAVRGILGVARLGTRTWSPHPQVIAVQRDLGAHHPAFAIDTEVS
ncbi:MAG: aminodeoxychorismate lyase [Pseudomonadota bacterium]|nr:aminodeoxychorismate lyase [Pseudomonadota bacterium]